MAGIVATISGLPGNSGDTKTERYTLTNGAPTIAVASGAGTGGTATISSGATDCGGQVVITTGTAIPGGGGTLAVVTFANTLAGTPSPVISAAGANAAALIAGTASPWTVATTTTFSILAGSATASTAYTIDYSIPDAVANLAITTVYMGAPSNVTGIDKKSQSFSGRTATIGLRPNFTSSSLTLTGSY
jgi:hypothetical protein